MTAPYYGALRGRWQRVHEMEKAAYRRPPKLERIRSSKVVAELKERYAITRDPRFLDAAMAVQELDERNPDWRRARVDANMSTCVARMDHLLRRDKTLSIRSAAAHVAVEFFIHADNFDAAVKKLYRAYQAGQQNSTVSRKGRGVKNLSRNRGF